MGKGAKGKAVAAPKASSSLLPGAPARKELSLKEGAGKYGMPSPSGMAFRHFFKENFPNGKKETASVEVLTREINKVDEFFFQTGLDEAFASKKGAGVDEKDVALLRREFLEMWLKGELYKDENQDIVRRFVPPFSKHVKIALGDEIAFAEFLRDVQIGGIILKSLFLPKNHPEWRSVGEEIWRRVDKESLEKDSPRHQQIWFQHGMKRLEMALEPVPKELEREAFAEAFQQTKDPLSLDDTLNICLYLAGKIEKDEQVEAIQEMKKWKEEEIKSFSHSLDVLDRVWEEKRPFRSDVEVWKAARDDEELKRRFKEIMPYWYEYHSPEHVGAETLLHYLKEGLDMEKLKAITEIKKNSPSATVEEIEKWLLMNDF